MKLIYFLLTPQYTNNGKTFTEDFARFFMISFNSINQCEQSAVSLNAIQKLKTASIQLVSR